MWGLLNYHLAGIVAILALLLLPSLRRRRCNAVAALLLLAVAVAIVAAVLGRYPLGAIRQNIYLGPVIFLAAGGVFHALAGRPAGRVGPAAWLTPALLAVFAGAIAFAGVGAIGHNSQHRERDNRDAIAGVLAERARAEDLVYVHSISVPWLTFYQEEKPGNYYYGIGSRWQFTEEHIREMLTAAAHHGGANRIWLVHENHWAPEGLKRWDRQVSVEPIVAEGRPRLYLIANGKELIAGVDKEWRLSYQSWVSGAPIVRANFDVYHHDNALFYVKEPCAAADTAAAFLLHITPVNAADLPAHRQQYGFDNLDFHFDRRGFRFSNRCAATVKLPDYAIASIRTGQYVPGEGPLWEAEFPGKFPFP